MPETAKDQTYYDSEDLEAQRVMARWTRIMGLAAIVGVLLSGLGVYLIYTTFQATLRAAKYSGVAARQGRRTLAHIKETTAAQLRPYVGLYRNTDDDEKSLPFARGHQEPLRIRNYGQTPAHNLRIQISSNIVKRPIGKHIVKLDTAPGEYPPLPPGAVINETITNDLPVDALANIASGQVLLTRIRLTYDWPGGDDEIDITLIMTSDKMQTGRFHLLSDKERERKE